MQKLAWRMRRGLCVAVAVMAAGPAFAVDAALFTESGVATWYGPRHEGHRTSSGERFDSHKLTAAHPTLPLGSYVRVTDESSGRSIVVRVTDREPVHGVRCIDLSRQAAAKLGFLNRGVADVTVAEIKPTPTDISAMELAEAPVSVAHAAPHAARHVANNRHKRHR